MSTETDQGKMTVISDWVLMSRFCVRHSRCNSERDWSVHFDYCADWFMLNVLLALFFCFTMKRQQNLSSFFTLKRMAVEPDKYQDGLDKDANEAGEVS